MKKIQVYKFFDLVLSGELGKLDIDNYIQEITDNHNPGKLAKLLNDIEYCLFCDKEERISNLTDKDYKEAFENLKIQGKELPMKTYGSLLNKNGEIVKEKWESLDLEKLFYPYEYFQIYQLINNIKYHIKEPINPEKKTFKPTIQPYEVLFLNVKNAEIVEKLFETNGYTIKRHWQGYSGNAGELSRAYHVLRDRHFLKNGTIKTQTETFYRYFKLADDYCDEKTRTRKDHNSDYRNFKRLFSDLTPF